MTYAGFEGESVLLEEIYKRGSVLPEVAPSLRAGDGMLFAWHHEPIAPWQTEAWLAEMRRSLRPNAFLRMIENRFVRSETSFIDLQSWDACVDPTVKPVLTDHLLSVWIGVDAASSATARRSLQYLGQTTGRAWLLTVYSSRTPDDPLDFESTSRARCSISTSASTSNKFCLILIRCTRLRSASHARASTSKNFRRPSPT